MSGYDLINLIAPEITLLIGGCAVLLLGLVRAARERFLTGWVALFAVLAALFAAWNMAIPSDRTALGMRVGDLVWYVRIIALGVGAAVLLVHWHLPRPDERGEMFSMILFSLAGVLITALADDLVLLFMALELVSVPTYVLVSIGRSDVRAQEAGVKYFFLGAMSSALMVYGFSFLYGASGTTVLSTMTLSPEGAYATLGLVLAFAGLAFKIAAVPLHVYAADVYQGAASPVTGLLGFFPKLAGFIAIIKLLWIVQPAGAVTSGWNLPTAAFVFLWIVAAATMTVGNVLGLMQTNVKRMLAYSSIAHSGYMLVGVLVGPVTGGAALRDGVSAALFYIVVYGLMNLGAFAVLAIISSNGRPAEDLDDLAGLARRQPVAALAMALCVFSLMGLPPTAGFIGKVFIFSSALSVGTEHAFSTALIVLAIIGLLNSAIAAAYYLRIVGACYVREPRGQIGIVPDAFGAQVGLLLCCAGVLVLGLWPRGLITMARQPFHDRQMTVVVQNTEASADDSNVATEDAGAPAYSASPWSHSAQPQSANSERGM
ncbi:MAG TPA: NADH-quinone oxidoreductase subunit N [Phycisphaerae bacterium]|nr:NADH-quinone oxidoreductase subunit N [Phycisphaerae bacterium]HOJ74346.1 NADH-quinone oxidoreductase subunit N [Phycisphaerae bacterium]HOM52970.1 NADH-quinone oxidoreductase subunit N [Phycisphaerae bacterium]HPU27107.1 NADH-quinone oxidoreductase subunit N [Phycisphaerae bacterium]